MIGKPILETDDEFVVEVGGGSRPHAGVGAAVELGRKHDVDIEESTFLMDVFFQLFIDRFGSKREVDPRSGAGVLDGSLSCLNLDGLVHLQEFVIDHAPDLSGQFGQRARHVGLRQGCLRRGFDSRKQRD